MRRTPSSSARTVAFVAAFCALAVAAGCGRESFDLLPEQTLDRSAAAGLSGASNMGGAGSPAAAGKAGGGDAGKTSGGGFGGRVSTVPGGGSGTFPCNGEGGCPDDLCAPYSTSPFCNGCFKNSDCESNGDAPVCNTDTKRCVQCRRDPDCDAGYGCNLAIQRCAKSCDRKEDCAADSKHLFCNFELHVCVACNFENDCLAYAQNLHCSFSSCVECAEERQCSINQTCVAGRCVKR